MCSGRPPQPKWSLKNPFEQKVFIENKGQYVLDKKHLKAGDIFFGAQQDGLSYYFTKSSIWIKHVAKVKRSKREIKAELEKYGIEEEENEEEKEFLYKYVDEFFQMEFEGSGIQTSIIAENQVSQLYTFGRDAQSAVSAHGYKKVIYKNLYPGVDMEFYFPEDKQGFKYNFILQPNIDPQVIKIKYPQTEKIYLTGEGDISIPSPFGNFLDHAPVAFESDSDKSIACSFSVNKNNVQFIVQNYSVTKGLVIDPWLTVPAFNSAPDGFDVDWDNAGNCYVYGGVTPYQLIKLDATGVILWTYTTSFSSSLLYYGDFAVDKNSGSCYIIDGFNVNGSEIIRTNFAGLPTALFPGDANFREMWRIAFNPCTNQAVIAGGGTSTPSYTGSYLDTNLTNMNLVNILSTNAPYHDMWGLTLDNFGNCYMSTALSTADNLFDNVLLKLPVPTLLPITWSANTNYLFKEATSNKYTYGNGFNGMAISNLNLYTYDSYILKQWNSGAGTLNGSAVVSGSSIDTMLFGGIAADDCDHVFLALNNTIVEYNNLTFTGLVATMPGNVYDLALDKSNILYSCGAGFVSATQLSLAPCSILNTSSSVTSSDCNLPTGDITLTVSGGTAPYTITWNTTPVQTGLVATNLGPGTYIATITDSSCVQLVKYDTVIVTSTTTIPNLAVTTDTVCSGTTVTLTASGGTSYTWSTGATPSGINTATVSPTTTTSYTVTATDNGCTDSVVATVVVYTSPTPVITASGATAFCLGDSVTLNAGAGYTNYLWNNGSTTQSITVFSQGTYAVAVTDSNGCTGVSASPVVVTVTLPDNASFIYTSASYCQSGINPTPAITGMGGGTFFASPGGLSITPATGTINLTSSLPGTYIVSYTTNGVCPATSSMLLSIFDSTSAAVFSYSSSAFCQNANNPFPVYNAGASAGIFSATPAGLTFVSNNSGEIDLAASIPGTYTITNFIPSSGACGTAIATTIVTINAADNVSFSYSSGTYCIFGANPTPVITGLNGGMFSSTPIGLSMNLATGLINLSGSNPGLYTVTYTTNGVCPNTLSIPIFITDSAVSAVFTYSATSFCQYGNNPSPVYAVGSSAGVFSSTPSGLVFVNVNTGEIDLDASAPGFYTITNTISISGACAGFAYSLALTITAAPVITSVSALQTGCDGMTTAVTLTSTIPGTSFTWTVIQLALTGASSGTGSTISQTLQLTGSSQGSVSYTVVPSTNGCSGPPVVFPFILNPLPEADTSGLIITPSLCGGANGSLSGVTMASGQPAFQYEWTDTAGMVVGTSLNLGNAGQGVYTLIVTDANGCSENAGSYLVNSASSSVIADFTPNPLTGENPLTVNFTNTSTGATSYQWQFGTGDTSSAVNPTYIYIPYGSFTVCLIATSNQGCFDTACSTIDVVVNSVFIIPNVFSPNNDNINDEFKIIADGLRTLDVEIYNRWGQKLYEWHTIGGSWNGYTAGGVEASDGTYYYILKATKADGKKYDTTGYFSLIRN